MRARRHQRFLLDHPQRFLQGVRLERRPSRQQLVQDRPQAVHIHRRAKDAFALGLFGRHVRRRAADGTGFARFGIDGVAAWKTVAGGGWFGFRGDARGQAEVGDHGTVLVIEQDVGRLQIAVQNTALMRVMYGPRHRRQQAGDGAIILLEARQMLVQTAAFIEGHGEVIPTLMIADLVNFHDFGMVQVRDVLGLGLEAFDLFGRRQGTGRDSFEGHDPHRFQLTRLVDDAHAAAADFFLQNVFAERLIAGRVAVAERRLTGMGLGVVQRIHWRFAGSEGGGQPVGIETEMAILLRDRRFAFDTAILRVQVQQLPRQGRALGFGDVIQKGRQVGPFAALPRCLEPLTDRLQTQPHGQRERFVNRTGVHQHR